MNERILTNKERNIFYHEGELDNQGLLHAQDAKSIAARDKEWVEKIERQFTIQYSNGEIRHFPYVTITQSEWQQLKKDMGVKE